MSGRGIIRGSRNLFTFSMRLKRTITEAEFAAALRYMRPASRLTLDMAHADLVQGTDQGEIALRSKGYKEVRLVLSDPHAFVAEGWGKEAMNELKGNMQKTVGFVGSTATPSASELARQRRREEEMKATPYPPEVIALRQQLAEEYRQLFMAAYPSYKEHLLPLPFECATIFLRKLFEENKLRGKSES